MANKIKFLVLNGDKGGSVVNFFKNPDSRFFLK